MKNFVLRSFICLTVLVLLFGPVKQGEALSIVQAASFSVTGITDVDLIGITPFDPALGTLDEVTVSIDGTLEVNGTFSSQSPTLYDIWVDHDFDGVADKFFNFDSPARFRFQGTAVSGGGFSFVRPFSYSFTFDETSDLIGWTVPTFSGPDIPPTSISGLRQDFLETLVPINEITLVQTTSFSGPIFSIDLQAGGMMSIQYDYTPIIPEPSSMFLLIVGLAGIMVYGLKKIKKRK